MSTPLLDGATLRELLAAAERGAETHQAAVVVAIVGAGGRMLAMQVNPSAFLTSDAVAVAKAFTAWNFREETSSLAKKIPEITRLDLMSKDGRLCFIAGGIPIEKAGVIVGGIGVSGSAAAVDQEIATLALREMGM